MRCSKASASEAARIVMDELLQDFLTEAGELLADVDVKLVELEKRPADSTLLNDVFRGFHTIKGGAGFVNLPMLVDLCHLTENVFDLLRKHELTLNAIIMDAILAATAAVRGIFDEVAAGRPPAPAEAALLARLRAVVSKEPAAIAGTPEPGAVPAPEPEPERDPAKAPAPDWDAFYKLITSTPVTAPVRDSAQASGRRAGDDPRVEEAPAGRRTTDKVSVARDTTIRIDTGRLDQVLTLSGELGLSKNRLMCLRQALLAACQDPDLARSFDEATNHLDLAVADLQRAVMKTRMQAVGRLFQKYPRIARDLARGLGKEVELVLEGEDTELDRSIIDDLSEPLVHLVRNAVDHGIETPAERVAGGKDRQSRLYLAARQEGDHVVIEIRDDGRGMDPDKLRRKALEKGLIDAEHAHRLDDSEALQLVFLPAFSTKEQVTNVSGRGVGMDVVKTAMDKLNGRITIESREGTGTTIRIALPLTLAILPVLVLRHGRQSFALPLTMVHEIVPLETASIQHVGGRATLVVRGEFLPVRSFASFLGWSAEAEPRYGVIMQTSGATFVLAVDGYVGREDVVIKPLAGVKPLGVAGATLAGDGSVVLVLDMEALLRATPVEPISTIQ
jgi:two-component system chemotaxis sensor kinase CheA